MGLHRLIPFCQRNSFSLVKGVENAVFCGVLFLNEVDMKVYLDLAKMGASYAVAASPVEYGDATSAEHSERISFVAPMSDQIDGLQRLERALQQLDPELRAVLQAKYGVATSKDLTNDEVAAQLGATVDSVAALEALALRALYTPVRRQ